MVPMILTTVVVGMAREIDDVILAHLVMVLSVLLLETMHCVEWTR